MAIVTRTPLLMRVPARAQPWAINATETASGIEELVAAPGAGKALYIAYIQFSIKKTESAANISFGEGQNEAVIETTYWGSLYTPMSYSLFGEIDYRITGQCAKFTDNKSFTVAPIADLVWIYAEGYTL